jgi:Mg2+-importing ATPase
MLWIGPTSSIFDITTFALMFFLIGPLVFGGSYYTLTVAQQLGFIALFQTGWFVESLWSQTLVIHMIRTPKIPFIQSRASTSVIGFTSAAIVIGTIIPYTPFGAEIGMQALPLVYYPWLIGTLLAYMAVVTLMKNVYIKRYGELL